MSSRPIHETQAASVPNGLRAQLVVLAGRNVAERFVVMEEIVLGRGKEADVRIDDDNVSRTHARISQGAGGTFVIEDLESRNGVAVNREFVQSAVLRFGDRIGLGGTVLLFLEQDEAQEQLLKQQKLQALGELAGGVAHDFNNLLGAILASVTHMQELGDVGEEVRRGLANVELAARRGADFTARLLTFGSPRKREYQPVALCRIIQETVTLLGSTLPRNIELDAECEPDLTVIGDSARLLQAVMNLCINAQDAMPAGGTLRVRARRINIAQVESITPQLAVPGEYAELCVSDTGVGMPEEVRREVFRPFFTTKERGQGTGLGLATALAVVKGHGGHISVQSQPGAGTQFKIHIPAAPRRTEAVAPDEETLRSTTARLAGTVLVADDEAVILEGLRAILERAGLTVIVASNGRAALEAFAKHRHDIDLVILDLDMPSMTGAEVLTRLRQSAPQTPVLISTGYVTAVRERELMDAGARGFLHKPYDANQLRKAVGVALVRD